MALFVGTIFGVFLAVLILKKDVDFFNPAILFAIIILSTYFLACCIFLICKLITRCGLL